MKNYDRITSTVWLGFALFVCLESARLPLGSFHDPGPGFLPLLMGVILAGLSIICFRSGQADRGAGGKSSWYSRERWKNLVWVLLTLLAYIFALERLGFLVSTFLFLTFLFRFGLEPMKWHWAAGGSAAASISCYAVFELWLKTQLPRGILGF